MTVTEQKQPAPSAPAGRGHRPGERSLFVVALLAVALTAGLLDQLTKWIAAAVLLPQQPLAVIPSLLSLQLQANPHGSFGLFSGVAPALRLPILLTLPVAAMAAITYYSIRILGRSRTVAVSLGLVLGGALANLTDRVARGEVVDFISLHWADRFRWPTFNLADVAITVGSVILAAGAIRLWLRKAGVSEAETLRP